MDDGFYLELAKKLSEASTESTKVGCVLVVNEHIVSTGSNYCMAKEFEGNREDRLNYVIHAEMVALLTAKDLPNKEDQVTAYIYPTFLKSIACHECAKHLVAFGVKRVVGYKCEEVDPRWQDSSDIALKLFNDMEVKIDEKSM